MPRRSVLVRSAIWPVLAAIGGLALASIVTASVAAAQGNDPCYALQPREETTSFTGSCSSTQLFRDVFETTRFDTYRMHIVGRVDGGPTVFSQFYAVPNGSSPVMAGLAGAQGALASYFGSTPYSIVGPTLVNASLLLLSSETATPLETSTTSTLSVQSEVSVGPSMILIGNRDLGGVAYDVVSGSVNINININTQYEIFRTVITTDTYETFEQYELVGRGVEVTSVPEPPMWALTAAGLAILGWRRRRRTVGLRNVDVASAK